MKILVINTGGTIGMCRTPHGFAPASGIVEAELERIVRNGNLPSAFDVVSLDPLIDSANATPCDWNRIAKVLADRHEDCDAFVVVHGTDTLAFTAAALCFALEGLAKPVILTGAMLPLTEPGSDGVRNLKDAVTMAAAAPRGVWVQFAGRLLHGARVWKTHSHSFDAFSASPASGPPFRHGPHFAVHRYAEPVISILPVAPGVSAQVIRFAASTCDGIVLRCYGSGTAPATSEFAEALTLANERDIPVVAVSQCGEGGIAFGTYAAGHMLLEHGVIDGRDMTVEAAYAKLAYALRLQDRNQSQRVLETALCGEFADN